MIEWVLVLSVFAVKITVIMAIRVYDKKKSRRQREAYERSLANDILPRYTPFEGEVEIDIPPPPYAIAVL
jgi:hypothetical protein